MAKFNNVVDRKKYLHKGMWQNPDQDVAHNFYYYFVQPLTMSITNEFNRQMVKPTSVIGIFGKHPFVKGDKLTLENGMVLQITEITFQYFENNIVSRDHLLPKIEEMVVVLE
jgi:hypothetical protein